MRGRLLVDEGNVVLGGLRNDDGQAPERAAGSSSRACGTSWHAGLVGEYMLEQIARIPAEVEYASEFRYRNPIINSGRCRVPDQPERRDGRHAGGAARGEGARARRCSAS